MGKKQQLSKKKQILEKLFIYCQQQNNFVFDNDLVEKFCKEAVYGNKFDVTKLDSKTELPPLLIQNNCGVIHLGRGKHQFVLGLDSIYHPFEPITNYIDWPYHKSLLNEYNSSEANLLSVANNQRILHHFLFGEDKEFDHVDISQRPKTYFPHRTNASFNYCVGETPVKLSQVQIEIDLTIEFEGVISVFEAKAKKKTPKNFSVFQLYHPFLYYYQAKQRLNDKIKEIIAVYVTKHIDPKTKYSWLYLWAYTFTDPNDCMSIQLKKSAGYKLISGE